MRRALVVGAAALLTLLPSLPAHAHATLLESDPADGATLDRSPDAVRLRFDERVEVPAAAIRVFNSSGARVDRGNPGHGVGRDEVEVSVPELRAGSYIVTWQAISDDGHLVRGAYVFQVGDSGEQVDESLIDALLGEGRSLPFATVSLILRWLTYLAALAAIGGVFFLVAVGVPRPDRVVFSIRALALVAIAGSVLQVPAHAAEITGLGWSALGSQGTMSSALTSSVATASLVRSLALFLIFVSVGHRRPPLMLIGAAGAVVAELLTGHTRTATPVGLTVGASALHVLTAAIWIGGLLALAISLRDPRVDGDAAVGARMVGRFSLLAMWSVAGVTLAGVVLAWVHVGEWWALTATSYGWTLVAKTMLAAGILGVAAYNNRVLVPAITAEASRDSDSDTGGESAANVAWDRLRRTVRVELVGLILVVGATALLVSLPPAAQSAGVTGPYAVAVPFGDLMLEVVVDPNHAGDNEIHLYLTTPGGFSPVVSGAFTMELSMPSGGIGPIVRSLQPAGPAHFLHIGPELAIPGEWLLTVRQRVSQFEEVSVEIPIRVGR